MKTIALTCLVAALSMSAASAAAQSSPAAAAPLPGQNQTPPPTGRGGRAQVQVPTPAQPGQQTPAVQPPEGGRGGRGAIVSRFDDKAMQNVRVDVTLTDTLAAESPSKKTVTLVVVDGNSGAIRSAGNSGLTLNIDASPHVRPDGRIFLAFSLQYLPAADANPNRGAPAMLNESLSVILSDGKPMVISQSADPRSDRRVTVEITATVVK